MSKKKRSNNERSAAVILAGASDSFWQINQNLAVDLADAASIQKQGGSNALGCKKKDAPEVDTAAPLIHCRIARQGQRALDDDNLIGGAKQLRDAIAQDILGLKGDSFKDGIAFEYDQIKSKTSKDTIVEIYIEE